MTNICKTKYIVLEFVILRLVQFVCCLAHKLVTFKDNAVIFIALMELPVLFRTLHPSVPLDIVENPNTVIIFSLMYLSSAIIYLLRQAKSPYSINLHLLLADKVASGMHQN